MTPRVHAALAVAVAGQVSSASTAPPLRAAARWLEERCAATGCLVNALPTPIDAVAWADLQAGARMPLKDKRAEAFVLKHYPPAWLAGVRWDARVAAARAAGWTGPVLYVRTAVRSMAPYSDVFDPEHRLEGAPDPAGAAPLARFADGEDAVEIFAISR
jgi:hypothetical protein